MAELDLYIGGRLREEREAAGLSLAALGERIGRSAAEVAAYEAGERGIPAAELAAVALVLRAPISAFYPGVQERDLDDSERAMLALFRELDDDWQRRIIESLRTEVALIQESRAISALPQAQQKQAAYTAMARYLLENGAEVRLGRQGRPEFQGSEFTAMLQGMSPSEQMAIAEAAYRLQQTGDEE